MLHFHVHQKLVCCSWVCHGLEVHLCILPLILNLLWCELSYDFSLFIGLLLSKAGPLLDCGFSLLEPILYSFRNLVAIPAIPLCYSYYGVTWPVLAGPPLGLLHVLLSIGFNDPVWSLDLYSYYFRLSWPITLFVGPFGLFLSPRASLAHLHSLGILGLISNSVFSWVFTNSFRLPWPNYLILHPWGSWAFYQPLSYFITLGLPWPILAFLHHIMAIGLLFPSLGSSKPICFPQGPFLYFIGLWSIIPAIRV